MSHCTTREARVCFSSPAPVFHQPSRLPPYAESGKHTESHALVFSESYSAVPNPTTDWNHHSSEGEINSLFARFTVCSNFDLFVEQNGILSSQSDYVQVKIKDQSEEYALTKKDRTHPAAVGPKLRKVFLVFTWRQSCIF